MKRLMRIRAAALALAALGALAAAAVGLWRARAANRDADERTARAVAAYLALVTPARDTDYALETLLVRARGIGSLPGWRTPVEVYHGRAALLGSAPPLDPAIADRLVATERTVWDAGSVVAPLKDPDDWNVVGAVRVAAAPTGPASLGWPGLAALAVALLAGAWGAARIGRAGADRRRTVVVASGAALLLAAGVTAGARAAARRATDRWLDATRILLEDAAVHGAAPRGVDPVRALASVARGATLSEEGTTSPVPQRVDVDGEPTAEVGVRLGPGRWIALRAAPGEAGVDGVFVAALLCALLAPAGLALGAWVERERARRIREAAAAWGFLTPAMALLAVFAFAPIVFTLYLSVHRWSPIEPVKPFVGLANFAAAVRDPLVWISLRNTVLYTLHVPVAMALALGAALLLQRAGPFTRVVRTLFFLPYVSSVVAVALVWQWMYHPDFGVINYLLRRAGVAGTDWLGNPRTALLAVMAVSIWVQVGYQMVLFLAGLQGIPRDYLDAARIDGANAWRRFWRITFPLLKPVTLFVLVTGVITSFQVFTYVYVLTDGGPLHATDVIVYRIYQTAWEFLHFGYASALSLLLFVLLFGVTWAQFRLLGRRVEYG